MNEEIDGLINESDFREVLKKLLVQYGVLPYKRWKRFELVHEKPRTHKERKLAFQKISKNVGKRGGLYVYEKGGKTLYVGRGSSLERRLKRHYRESFYDSTRLNKTQSAFFSEHTGKLTVYWMKSTDEVNRRGYEGMLIFALEPVFEAFRENLKSKRGKTV